MQVQMLFFAVKPVAVEDTESSFGNERLGKLDIVSIFYTPLSHPRQRQCSTVGHLPKRNWGKFSSTAYLHKSIQLEDLPSLVL